MISNSISVNSDKLLVRQELNEISCNGSFCEYLICKDNKNFAEIQFIYSTTRQS